MNWESDALLIDVNSIKEINCNFEWFLLWFWGALGWLVEAELDTFATSKSHLRHELVRQLTETQNTEKKISYCVTKGSATHWKGLQKQNWKYYKQNSNTFGVSSRNLTPNTWQASIINKTTSSSKKKLASLNKISPPPPFQRSLRRWRWTAVVGRWTLRPTKIHGFTIFYLLSFYLSLYCVWAAVAERWTLRPPLSNLKGKIT